MQLSRFNYSRKINDDYTLINNTLTGALDLIENNIWELFVEKKFTQIESDPLSNLTERGYIYPDISQEEAIFTKLFNSYLKKAKSRPIRFVFCPTYTCNLNCIYCFEKDLGQNRHKFMDLNMLDKALKGAEMIAERNYGRMESVELYGGEPLTEKTKGMVEKILNFALKIKAPVTIVTNGVKAGQFTGILKPVKQYIEMLQITIDGPREIHDKRRSYKSGKGTFDEIVSSIEMLLENGINVNVRVNIDNTNYQYLPYLCDYVENRGWLGHPHFKIMLAEVTDHCTTSYNDVLIEPEKLLVKIMELYKDHPRLEQQFGYYMFKPLRHLLDIISGSPNVSPKFFNCESNLLELNIFCPDGLIYVCGESIGNPDMAIGKYTPDIEFFPRKQSAWKERNILNLDMCRNCCFGPV